MIYDPDTVEPRALPMLDSATLEPNGTYRAQVLAIGTFTHQCGDPDCHCHDTCMRVLWSSDEHDYTESEALAAARLELECIRAGFSDRDHP